MAEKLSLAAQLRNAVPAQKPRGVIQWIRDIFSITSSSTFNLTGDLDMDSENERIGVAQKLYDYYSGDMERIQMYVQESLGLTFSAQDISEFQMLYIPVMRRIIDKICVCYNGEEERSLDDEGATQKYNEIISRSDINARAKHWHRMGKLFHTVLVQPVVREVNGERLLQYDIFTPNKCMVVEKMDNILEPEKVVIVQQVRQKDGSFDIERIYWTDTEHFATDSNGQIKRDEANPDRVNPYQELPFAVLRMRETENFWGEGETILANVEEKIDVLLCQMMDTLIMQGHGQPVFTNAQIEGDVKTGPKHPLKLVPSNPDQPASFAFVSVSGKIKEITDAIDWLIEKTKTSYGLVQSTSQSTQVSGYSKLIDNWDIVEQREQDISILQEFERELFRKTAVVLQAEGIVDLTAQGFNIEFDGYEFPNDPLVEIKTKQEKLKLGLWKPTDDLMEEDETLTQEEADKIWQENLAARNQMNDEFGLYIGNTQTNTQTSAPTNPNDMMGGESGT